MADAQQKDQTGRFMIQARLSFEHIWEKSASVKNGPLKHRANFIIDPSTKEGKKAIAAIEKARDEAIGEIAAWKGKLPRLKEDRDSYYDGDDMLDKDGNIRNGYEDMKYIKCTNDRRPKLRTRDGKGDIAREDDLIYSGAFVALYGRFYAMNDPDKGGPGLFCSMDGVQFVRHGEKFEGGGIDDDAFHDFGDDEDDAFDDSAKSKAKSKGRSIDDDEI